MWLVSANLLVLPVSSVIGHMQGSCDGRSLVDRTQIAFARYVGRPLAYKVSVIPKTKPFCLNKSSLARLHTVPNLPRLLELSPVKERAFCDLPQLVLAALGAISCAVGFPKGAVLFIEGQRACGVFMLCSGRVKLSINSDHGRSIIVGIAEPGEVAGLSATISGSRYEVTAETLEPLRANFVPREAFLRFLRNHGEAALRVAEILTRTYQSTLTEVRYLGLSSSSTEKLACFLLDLPIAAGHNNGHARATLTLTHQEIGEMIGASRETVSRTFAYFKRGGLIEVHGSSLIFTDRASLEKLTNCRESL